MKISIITACLNAAHTIKQTIASITNQDYQNFEYIIIDGGSTDETISIVESSEIVSHWISEPDKGISDAFNKGIALCSGDIIGLLNADDVYLPGTLNTVSRLFTPQLDILSGSIIMKGRHKDIIRAPKLSNLGKCMSLNHPATFIRKSTYDMIGGYDTRYKYAMDYDLLLRAHIKGARIGTIDDILTVMSSGGLSDVKWVEAYHEVAKIKIAANYPSWKASSELLYQVTRTCLKKMLERLRP